MSIKKLLPLLLFSLLFLLLLTAASCGSTESTQKKEKQEFLFMQLKPVDNAVDANFSDLTDLFGSKEVIGDVNSAFSEMDIVSVSASDDKENLRFDIYHASAISQKYDLFFGFYQYWSDGTDLYQYWVMTNELYLTLFDKNGKIEKNYNLDLEKAKVLLIPWSLSTDKNPVNVVSIILNKEMHWGIKSGSFASLIIQFISGYYQKDEKKHYYIDYTPPIKIEFNY